MTRLFIVVIVIAAAGKLSATTVMMLPTTTGVFLAADSGQTRDESTEITKTCKILATKSGRTAYALYGVAGAVQRDGKYLDFRLMAADVVR